MNDINGFLKRRWPAMIASLLICICAGFGYAWSVLQTPIIAAHGWPDQQVSLTYTVTVLCSTMAPLFFGGLIRRLGTRRCVVVGAVLFGAGLMTTGWISGGVWQLYLFYGILSGLGTGFVYPAMMAYVVRLFPEKSGMASGLGTAAYGSGAILWAPVAAALIRSVNLRGTFCILGGAFLVLILLGSTLLVEPPQDLREALCPVSGNAPRPDGGPAPGPDGQNGGLLWDGGHLHLRSGGRRHRHQPGFPHSPERLRLHQRYGGGVCQRIRRLQHGGPLPVGQPV